MRTLSALMSLEGRVALVTGGAGHIGLAAGEALAECGAHVVVVDRDAAACEERARHLSKHGGKEAAGIAADLSDPAACKSVVERAASRFGRLDVLVNNAGFTGETTDAGWSVPFAQQTVGAWDASMRVNLTAPFLLVQAAQAALSKSGHGSVINVGSIYAVTGPVMAMYAGTSMENPAGYAAGKGGLLQLSRYLSTLLAPHIRVNSISPGGIERGQPASFQKEYVSRTPMGRMGVEEDLKGAFAFLAGDASGYITGQNLLVDGGWTAW
jgi:NAD(P)-dependent dehydrogenase (short-subunit alcohol dehydrogenase family)